ncbi:hemerythrin domain-containing protein [Actinoplanes sp. NPDC051346]|uniref:hemerythrin domain-containing protein n=1 Tax=Actinoplanes sp. NPDC051346 TaxID=3155048 RepID=UPI0034415F76
MTTPTAPKADSRDMYVVHSAFRREFPAAPALVRAVPAGDAAAVARVADHVALITELLNHHHQGEDDLVWPKLLDRAPAEVAPLVETMRRQHHALHGALAEVDTRAAAWRAAADATSREALAAALEAMIPPMVEHLDTEEEHLLPLIDKHLTAGEWAQVGEAGMKKTPKSKLPVIFGMVVRDGAPEHVATLKAVMPPPVWFVLSRIGPRAFDRYSRRVAG